MRSDLCRLHCDGSESVSAPRRGPHSPAGLLFPQPQPEAGTHHACPERPLLWTLRAGGASPRRGSRVWLPSLSILFQGSSLSEHGGTSFLWPNNVPPCGRTFCSSIRWSRDIWVFPPFGSRASYSCVRVPRGHSFSLGGCSWGGIAGSCSNYAPHFAQPLDWV